MWILELLRIFIIIIFLGGLLYYLLTNFYDLFDINIENSLWLVYIAIFIIIFVIYRNIFQFKGWARAGSKKLPVQFTVLLLSIAILLLIFVFIWEKFYRS
ncbi:hypothetical protein CD30_13380 [Ureibacillus massiliensis 4400831 = CIP 108448 = CCUG 49529]|uniref:Uncharacterized protein n=1 Tax=Ureibacillus massiliensis 4400831 = CIP 108448 = CCUG 49529 TaxID=1211035 RepID=A0A0A3J4N6_9BACL|nr:hypothetical protein CD30_13380 [Ureibacillus massiliensis 4400831 = CIP 108448 = CCUG 49529]